MAPFILHTLGTCSSFPFHNDSSVFIFCILEEQMQMFHLSAFSIAGNFPPASCIFSEVMNLSAFLGKNSNPPVFSADISALQKLIFKG